MNNQSNRSMLCPNCRKLISRDETKCPYCGLSRPNSGFKRLFLLKPLNDPIYFIRTVIYINIGMYVISLLLNSRPPGLTMNPFTMLSPDANSLVFLGATGRSLIEDHHRWWTLISANYLHGGLLHILFNMMAFWQLYPIVIREFGLYRAIIIYSVSGAGGFFLSYLAGIQFTIGASAAIFGLMGALIYYGKSRGGIYGQTVYKQVGGWALGILLLGFMVPVVNNWGHGGGLLSGVLLAFLLGYQESKRETSLHRTIALACVVITVLTLVWGVVSGLYLRLLS